MSLVYSFFARITILLHWQSMRTRVVQKITPSNPLAHKWCHLLTHYKRCRLRTKPFARQEQYTEHKKGNHLKIHLRIPIRVVDDDNIGSGEVDTQTASAGGQHEEELFAVGEKRK